MEIDKTKSLQQLENEVMEKPDFQTSLTLSVYRLWTTPLIKYKTDDLRLMIGQNIGLKYLIPIANEKLAENPFVNGDHYFGDLLWCVLSVENSFWKSQPQLYYELIEIVSGLPDILKNLFESIEKFEKIEI